MFSLPIPYSTLSISSYPPFTIPRLQTNRNYCADQVLSVSTSAYALIHRFRSWSAGRSIAVWQLENFDQSLQDFASIFDCCFTSNPTEGPTSCTALINRVLVEKNPPSPPVITRCEIKYCGKSTDSFFSLCLLMLFLCTWWLTTKDLLDKCSTSLGIIFQMGNNNVNLILPLQISSFIYCHVLAYSLLWLFTAVTTSAVK